MEDFIARDDLIPRDTLATLQARSDAKGLAQLCLHLAALAATGALVLAAPGPVWRLAAMAAHGVVLVFLFSGLHECVHRTAFRSRWLNDSAAIAAGFFLALPAGFFRHYHFAHHRHTQDPARDPELVTPKPGSPKPISVGQWAWAVSGLPHWRDRLAIMGRHALTGRVGESFAPVEARTSIVQEARAHWAGYLTMALASLALGSTAPVLLWIGPAILGQPVLRLFLLAEHAECALSADMLQNTRTTHSNALVRLLSWNMPYHVEHHLFPAVPFHALPTIHALIKDRIAVEAPGYAAFHKAFLARLGAQA